jgi:hypothetical protein
LQTELRHLFALRQHIQHLQTYADFYRRYALFAVDGLDKTINQVLLQA